MNNYIFIKNKRYFFYGRYGSWNEAYKQAKAYQKKDKKCKYFIIKVEEGYLFPYEMYKLYLNRVINLSF